MNVGESFAKVLVISGFGEGDKMGCPIYSKIPSGDLTAPMEIGECDKKI